MANLPVAHGVSGCFGTSLAPSKGFSFSLNGGSETGQPASQFVLPSRRCSIMLSSRSRISQRWPSTSVLRRKWLTGSTAFHTGRRSQEAAGECGDLKVWNQASFTVIYPPSLNLSAIRPYISSTASVSSFVSSIFNRASHARMYS